MIYEELFAKKSVNKSEHHLEMQLFGHTFCVGWYYQYQFSYSTRKTYAGATMKEILYYIFFGYMICFAYDFCE